MVHGVLQLSLQCVVNIVCDLVTQPEKKFPIFRRNAIKQYFLSFIPDLLYFVYDLLSAP